MTHDPAVPTGAAPAADVPPAQATPAADVSRPPTSPELAPRDVEATAPVEPPLPKPATWSVKPPSAPWCPPAHRDAILGVLSPAVATRFRGRCDRADTANGVPNDDAVHGDGLTVRAAAWTVTAATRRGRRHAHVGEWGEDAHFAALDATRGVLVVADGAGSASWSRLGSAIAVDVVGEALGRAADLDAAAMHSAIREAVDTLRAAARAMDVAPRLLRTTILAVAWEPAGTRHRLVTTQVGDGSLVLVHADGTINRPAVGDGGEWSGEVHCFLPDDETMTRAEAATVVHDVPDLAALLLVTDGIDDPFYPFPKHAGAILGQLVHGATTPLTGLASQDTSPALAATADPAGTLHAWLGFEKRGENDDRTLAVALHDTAAHVIAPWAPSASA
jgi:hypothetical protein